MTDDQQLIEPGAETRNANVPNANVPNERREFFKAALGAAAVTAAGASALAIATSASAATIADNDIFRFLVQLDYLAGQYFSFATTGAGLSAALLTGQTTDTAGSATGARQVTFTDPVVAQYATEITQDLVANITYIRTQLGADGIVSQPAIDLGTSATSAFGKLATAAGIATAGAFDPYASDGNFLLGAFMIEDVIVTAYIGALTVISDKTLLAATTGILATHAHHAAVIRALLYAKGATTASLRTSADAISNVRDNLDGTTSDLDQGISPTTISGNVISNITPAAANGSILGRTVGHVLNEFYLNSAAVSLGGFYTAGLNGAVKVSTAN
jgi:hypothetical protein